MMRSARHLSLLLLFTGIFSWLNFLVLHPVLSGRGLPGLPLLLALFLGVAMGAAATALLARAGSRRITRSWERIDRDSLPGLRAFVERLDAAGVLKGESGRKWSALLLDRFAALGPLADEQDGELVLHLFEAAREARPGWSDLLCSLPATADLSPRVLLVWNRFDAFGVEPVMDDVDRRLEQLAGSASPVAARGLQALILARARAGVPAARTLVLRLLNGRRMKLRHLPQELHAILEDPALDPRVTAEPISRKALVAIAALRSWRVPRFSISVSPRYRRRFLIGGAGMLLLAILLSLPWPDADEPASVESPALLAWEPAAEVQGGFTVQVMASKDSVQARQEVERLRGEGLWSYLLEPRPNSAWYRVRFGHFGGRATADSIAADLKERQLIDAWYVANFERKSDAR